MKLTGLSIFALAVAVGFADDNSAAINANHKRAFTAKNSNLMAAISKSCAKTGMHFY